MGEYLASAQLDSFVGTLRLAATEKGLVRVSLPGGASSGFASWLQRALPDADAVDELPVLERARHELEEYLAGVRREFTVDLDLRGTPFQLAVWHALAEIPYGQTCSYADIARAAGSPRAFRAVGRANGANPVPIIIPCHRVIASDGSIGGYGGGLEAKRRLLAFEQGIAHPEQLL